MMKKVAVKRRNSAMRMTLAAAAVSLALACPSAMAADPAITKAMEALRQAAPRVQADPTRPVYHFLPPAQWMNDPCGGIHHKGYYHLFYQLNPYGDQWANIHWGHARSKDLVCWEHLPIALAPQPKEVRCNSGCVAVNKRGEPMIFYTSVLPNAPREHCAAIGDADLIAWKRHPANPLLTLDTHGGPRFGGGWSDPFIFEEAGRTFMVIGVDVLGSDVAIPLYEATDAALSRWIYRGLLFRAPRKEIKNMEVPMFFKLNGKWVLLFHPGGPIKYFIGSFDLHSLTFKPEKEGTLVPSKDFSSPHIFFDDKGQCILFGWLRGFKSGRGWNGCLALPRVLSMGSDGLLRQKPVPELQNLRGKHFKYGQFVLDNRSWGLENVSKDTLEMILELEPAGATTVGLKLRRCEDETKAVTISYDRQNLNVAGIQVSLQPVQDKKALRLHIFLDKSVLEVFANDGRVCVAKVVYPGEQALRAEVFAAGGTATVRSLDIWEMKSIW